jgi:hypothetical protein
MFGIKSLEQTSRLTCRRVGCGRGRAQQRDLTRHRNRRAALCTRLGHRELARRDRRQLGRGGGGVRGVGRVVECPSIYISAESRCGSRGQPGYCVVIFTC